MSPEIQTKFSDFLLKSSTAHKGLSLYIFEIVYIMLLMTKIYLD